MTKANFTQSLYRGQRPNWMARVVSRAWAVLASSGIASRYLAIDRLVTLEVIGRKSGRPISQPMVIIIIKGQRYLVSMLGYNVRWVHNV